MRTLIAAAALVLTTVAASAGVFESDLRRYAPNVDPSTLTKSQINVITMIIHSNDSPSEKRGKIKAIARK